MKPKGPQERELSSTGREDVEQFPTIRASRARPPMYGAGTIFLRKKKVDFKVSETRSNGECETQHISPMATGS